MERANLAPWVSWTSTRPLRPLQKEEPRSSQGSVQEARVGPSRLLWRLVPAGARVHIGTTGYAVLVLFSSADCYERGRCVPAIFGVRVAPAHDEPRNGLNSTERESTSGHSTNFASAHLIRVFHHIGRTVSLLFLLTTRHPLVTQGKGGFGSGWRNMVSSEQKMVSIVFRAELTAVDEPAACAAL
jgi:hypothetical protein